MSNCSNQFPSTNVLYDELSSDNSVTVPVFIAICCLLLLVVLGVYIEEIWFIKTHYPHKIQRAKFICLLGLYPVVCFTSTISVIIPRATLLCELIASTFLSCCILLFVNMLISYFGGRRRLLEKMADDKIEFGTPPCCCCCLCLNNKPFNRKNLRIATFMVMQITLIKPLSLFIATVIWTDNRYTPGDETAPTYGVFYTNLVSIISTLIGVWGISVIYRSTRSKLPEYRVRLKFICLQFVILLMNLQFAILSILSRNDIPGCEGTRDSLVRGYRVHHSLLVLEMFLISILARIAYRRLEPDLLHKTDQQNIENGKIEMNKDTVST